MNQIAKIHNLSELKKECYEKMGNAELDLNNLAYNIERIKIKNGEEKINLSEKQFISLVRRAKQILANEPGLLKLAGPIRIATGTLGDYKQLSGMLVRCDHPKFVNYLFLGDYAGRCEGSVECLVAYCLYKVMYPLNFFMLRGCHQCIGMARSYDLYDQLCERYSSKAWLQVCEMFCSLPFAALVDGKVFAVHGGIGPTLKNVEQINNIQRIGDIPDKDIACDLVWADHNPNANGWQINQRGVSFTFGNDVVSQFCSLHNFTIMVRAHQVVEKGFIFSPSKKLVTICSLANYCGFYRNSAAIANIDDQGNFFLEVIKQKEHHMTKEMEQKGDIRLENFLTG